jgi:hypothetical protein
MNCLEFRRATGAEPGLDGPALAAHREGCPACARFQREMQDMDRLLGRAMQVRVTEGSGPSRSPGQDKGGSGPISRWWAMAASLVAGVIVAAALWVSWPEPSLASEVFDHAVHEPEAWSATREVSGPEVAKVLDASGATLRPGTGTVTYARRCFFDHHWVPHLVVQTEAGPVTVFLLGHREVAGETRLEGGGYEAIVLPAPRGSIAVVGRDVPGLDAVARQVFASVEWPA